MSTGIPSGGASVTVYYGDTVAGNATQITATASSLTDPSTSQGETVDPSTPSQLAIVVGPTGTATGVPMTPAVDVAVEDQFGNATDASGVAVSASSTGAFATGATTSVSSGSNGIAVFSNLVFSSVGSYTLTFASSGLTSATSSSFSVVSPDPAQLGFTSAPVAGNTDTGNSAGPITFALENAVGGLATAPWGGSRSCSHLRQERGHFPRHSVGRQSPASSSLRGRAAHRSTTGTPPQGLRSSRSARPV